MEGNGGPKTGGGGETIGRALKKIQCQKPNLFLGDQKWLKKLPIEYEAHDDFSQSHDSGRYRLWFFFLHCGTTRVLLAQRCMWCKLWVCPGITSNHPEASRKVLCCCMDFLGVCFLG